MKQQDLLCRRGFLAASGVSVTTGFAAAAASAQQTAPANETDSETPTGNSSDPTGADDSTAGDDDSSETDETDESDPAAFDPEINVGCYSVDVDAPRYDRVDIAFDDGTIESFEGDFSDDAGFGYAGDGAIYGASEDRVVESFHGPIERVTVSLDGESVTSEGTPSVCPATAVEFDCESVTVEGSVDDVRATFADGSVKRWDPPQEGTERFGSPGRVITELDLVGNDLQFRNPNPDCAAQLDGQSGDESPTATRFSPGAVTIAAEEFESGTTFAGVELEFTDGSRQIFGDPYGTDQFEPPEQFTATGENEGKAITAVNIGRQEGDVWFRLLNPAPEAADQPVTEEDVSSDDHEEQRSVDGDVDGDDGDDGDDRSSDDGGDTSRDEQSRTGESERGDSGEPQQSPPTSDSPTDADAAESSGRIDDESTTEPAPSFADREAADRSTTDRSPGFGLFSALAAAGGTTAYLYGHIRRTADEEIDSPRNK